MIRSSFVLRQNMKKKKVVISRRKSTSKLSGLSLSSEHCLAPQPETKSPFVANYSNSKCVTLAFLEMNWKTKVFGSYLSFRKFLGSQ